MKSPRWDEIIWLGFLLSLLPLGLWKLFELIIKIL